MSETIQRAVTAAYPRLERYGFSTDYNTVDGALLGAGGEHYDYRIVFRDRAVFQVLAPFANQLDKALRKHGTGFRVEMDAGDGYAIGLRYFHNSDQPFMLHELEQAVNSALAEAHIGFFLEAYTQHSGLKAAPADILSGDGNYAGFPRRIVFRLEGESADVENVFQALSASAELARQKAVVSRVDSVITIQNSHGISTPELSDDGRFQEIRAKSAELFIRAVAGGINITPNGMAVTLDLRHQTERGYPKDAYISLGYGVFSTNYPRVAEAVNALVQDARYPKLKLAGYHCTAKLEEGKDPVLELHAEQGISAGTLNEITKALRERGA